MAAITGTLAQKLGSSPGGDLKFIRITCIPGSASDTVTLTAAVHGISEVIGVIPSITAGQDAALAGIYATFSGLVITVVTTAAAGTAATDWTGATADLIVIGKQSA